MIKTHEGVTEIEGSQEEIMADLTIIIMSFREALVKRGMSVDDADKKIDKAIGNSKLTTHELQAKVLLSILSLFGGM